MSETAPPSSSGEERSGLRHLTLPQLWVIAAIALPVIASLEASLSAVDLAYQIRAGDVMLRTHSLIRVDTFTFTAVGRPWLDQQWGAQVILAMVHRVGGFSALAVLRALVVGGIYLFVYRACRAAGAGMRQAAWLTLGSFLATYGGLALRPQLFAMALFALTVWLVTDRARHPGGLWIVPGLVAIWANLHGSFFLAPLLLGMAWLQDRRDDPRGARRLASVALVGLAAATVNPFGLRVWSYVASLSTNPTITRLIEEWQPPTIRDIVGATFFLSAIVVAALLARRGRQTPGPVLLALGVFFVLALFAVRGVFWWGLVVPPMMVPVLQDLARRRPAEPRPAAVNTAIAAFLAFVIVWFLPWWRGELPATPSSPPVSDAPAGVTAELRRVLEPGRRIFNPQIWGSWFEFALPDDPVFADARIEVIPTSAWSDYRSVSRAEQGWQGILDRWRVDVVVANEAQQSALIPHLRDDPGWRLVYHDRNGYVFVRA